jgi:hypothetical protein
MRILLGEADIMAASTCQRFHQVRAPIVWKVATEAYRNRKTQHHQHNDPKIRNHATIRIIISRLILINEPSIDATATSVPDRIRPS